MKLRNYIQVLTTFRILAAPFVVALGLGLAGSVHAAIDLVTNTNDSGAGSLRQIISDAVSGDTLTFATNLSGAIINLTSGKVLLEKSLTIDGSALAGGITLNGNNAGDILEVASGNTVVLNSLTFTNASASGVLNSGAVTLNRCAVVANWNGIDGESGQMTVNQSIITGNLGSGLFINSGVLTVNQSTIAGNLTTSGVYGGGIYNYQATATLNQCTIAGNSADLGGGVVNYGGMTVNQCTITGNSALYGGGIENYGGMTLSNSIVATNSVNGYDTNTADIDNLGTLTRMGANIIQMASGQFGYGTFSGPAAINADPLLAPLGNYGGSTPTMPPLPGSPAIDACTNGASFTTDQRGFTRIVGPFADIGSVEGVYNPAGPGTLTGVMLLNNGSLQLGFTNSTDMSFHVLASTNMALPPGMWSDVGAPVEMPAGSGQYQFTDLQATNSPQRFYRVRWP